MDNNLFEEISKGLIINYYRTHFPLLYDEYKDDLTESRIYCVWVCKTLQNNKGLFSTNIPDSRYFEITQTFLILGILRLHTTEINKRFTLIHMLRRVILVSGIGKFKANYQNI